MIKPSVVNSARVSARLIRNGIREVARMVYKGQVEGGDGELALVAELDLFGFHELTWDRMVAQGTVGREIVTNKDIRKMFKPCNIRQRIVEMASARYVLAWPSNFSSCEVVLGSRPMPSMSSTTLSIADWTAAKCSAQPNANAVPGNSAKDTAKTIEATNVPDKRCCLIIVGPTEPLQ